MKCYLLNLKTIAPNVHTDKPRHLVEMQRPISTSSRNNNANIEQQPKRISSTPIIPKVEHVLSCNEDSNGEKIFNLFSTILYLR